MSSDISLHQLSALLFVATHGEDKVPFAELGEFLGLSTAALSRNVDALAEGFRTKERGFGVIERKENLQDRRHKQASITSKGVKLLSEISEALKKEEARQARKLGR
jgi:DNA-binding MarR family transcriptional regulator